MAHNSWVKSRQTEQLHSYRCCTRSRQPNKGTYIFASDLFIPRGWAQDGTTPLINCDKKLIRKSVAPRWSRSGLFATNHLRMSNVLSITFSFKVSSTWVSCWRVSPRRNNTADIYDDHTSGRAESSRRSLGVVLPRPCTLANWDVFSCPLGCAS